MKMMKMKPHEAMEACFSERNFSVWEQELKCQLRNMAYGRDLSFSERKPMYSGCVSAGRSPLYAISEKLFNESHWPGSRERRGEEEEEDAN